MFSCRGLQETPARGQPFQGGRETRGGQYGVGVCGSGVSFIVLERGGVVSEFVWACQAHVANSFHNVFLQRCCPIHQSRKTWPFLFGYRSSVRLLRDVRPDERGLGDDAQALVDPERPSRRSGLFGLEGEQWHVCLGSTGSTLVAGHRLTETRRRTDGEEGRRGKHEGGGAADESAGLSGLFVGAETLVGEDGRDGKDEGDPGPDGEASDHGCTAGEHTEQGGQV